MDISEEAIAENCAYIIINKEVERVSKKAMDDLHSKDIILTFPSMRNNNKTVRVLKTPKTESSIRHTSVTYKLKLSGGDIKAVQGDSGHAKAEELMALLNLALY